MLSHMIDGKMCQVAAGVGMPPSVLQLVASYRQCGDIQSLGPTCDDLKGIGAPPPRHIFHQCRDDGSHIMYILHGWLQDVNDVSQYSHKLRDTSALGNAAHHYDQ